jgi:hypothetical protein
MSSIFSKAKAIVDFLNDPNNKIDDATAYLCNGQIHAQEILRNNPGTPKIAVGFSKGQARVNFPGGDITGRENEYFYAIISRGRGLSQDRADNIFDGVEGGKPLLQDAEILRDLLRAIRFDPISDEQPDYVSIEEWGVPQGFNMDGFKITIWVGTQMCNDNPIDLNAAPL